MFKYFTILRLVRNLFLSLAHLPMSGNHRWRFVKCGGVEFSHKKPCAAIYDNCEGYWDMDLKWHQGEFNPSGWMVDLVK